MQFSVIPVEKITTLGVSILLMDHPNPHMIFLLQALYKTHAPSTAPLDISSSPASYNSQCPLAKACQYLSHTLLFNTIHDYPDNPKHTVPTSPLCVRYVSRFGEKLHIRRMIRHTPISCVTQSHPTIIHNRNALHHAKLAFSSLLCIKIHKPSGGKPS